MLRRLLFLTALAVVVTPGIVAQDAPQANRIYVATYMVNMGDILEYQRIYQEQGVPILEELVEEGMLVGFNMRMHHTGGEYTLREGGIGNADTDYGKRYGFSSIKSFADYQKQVPLITYESIKEDMDRVAEVLQG